MTPLSQRRMQHRFREAAAPPWKSKLGTARLTCLPAGGKPVYYRKVYGMNDIMMREWLEHYGDAVRVP